MIRFTSTTSLFSALIIVLLHGVIPHYHEGEIDSQDHLALHEHREESVWERIAFAFHEQSSTEEFSQFNVIDGLELDDNTLECSDFITPLYSDSKEFSVPEPKRRKLCSPQFWLDLNANRKIDLRGPPRAIS